MPLFTSPWVMNQNNLAGGRSLDFFLRQRRDVARAFAVLAMAAGAAQMVKRFACLGRLPFVGILHLLRRCRSVMKIRVLSSKLRNQKKSGEDKSCKGKCRSACAGFQDFPP